MYVSSTDFCRRAGERRRFALFYLLVALCTNPPLGSSDAPLVLHSYILRHSQYSLGANANKDI
jgi:hypothetical protein